MYDLQDLDNPVIISSTDAWHDPLSKAVENAFCDEFQYASVDDVPFLEYDYSTGEAKIDDITYAVSFQLQHQLQIIRQRFYTIPLPNIRFDSIQLKFTHPENEDEKGLIEIEKIIPNP